MSQKKTKEQFIEEARLIHGDKYDYSKVEYVNNKKPVCIICPEHGEFWQAPHNHIRQKNGCPFCNHRSYKYTTEEFIQRAREVHGDKYDYSKVFYERKNKKVCIICPEHGEFWQSPEKHLSGQGCAKCYGNVKMTQEEFVVRANKIHRGKYDYSKVIYDRYEKKVCIICPEHGEFWQTPHAHLAGQGCQECYGNKRCTKERFIEKARKVHGDKYDYSKVDYKNNKTPVCIVCPKHGEFWQSPFNHIIEHQGCPKCAEELNVSEQRVVRFLKENTDYQIVEQYSPEWLGQKRIDIYLPEKKVGIEYQGRQHFVPVDLFGGEDGYINTKKRDTEKYNLCKEHGVKLFYITYEDRKFIPNDYFDTIYTENNELLEAINRYGCDFN